MGVGRSVLARKSTREDEQGCEAGGKSKRRREHIAPDDIEDTLGGDGKRVRSCDNGGASGAIVRYGGRQLHCSDEETESLLFSSKPRAAACGNVLDPSGSGENVQKLRLAVIDPVKHKIFLSHSGAQKNFVEQLCVDLEARGYLFPFFDQRHHSLPKGEDFAPLIKRAAGLCHVAVIVLSKEFLCSKWPMIELAEFHAAKQVGNHRMRMLPLFYELAVGDLDERSIVARWMPVWNELASRDKRIDVSRWAAAVRALRGANGLPFGKHNNSEVGYREEIVRSIWKTSPADLLYGSAREMVGYDRICERVSKKFVEATEVGASVLGLYGTSGVGKTSLAKALCDYFAEEFEGRVCHVELGTKKRMKRQKLMLMRLCGFQEDVLNRLVDDRQGLNLLREHMKREPVFLVIDNVTDDSSSRREVQEYLSVLFHRRSKVMITARSKEVLQELVRSVEFCMSIPKLNEEEAGMIFLRSADPLRPCFSPVTDEERRVLRLCVEKCLLESYDSESDDIGYSVVDENLGNSHLTGVPRSGAYHPMALSALGDYFYRSRGNTKILDWEDSLEENRELMREVLQSPSITSIIHLQFSTFSWSEQLLFLDLAVYLNRPDIGERGFFLVDYSFKEWVYRLATMHGETTSVVERRLSNLKRSGMINYDIEDDFDDFLGLDDFMHRLYREFGKWYMTEHGVAGLKNAWGVIQPCGTSLGSDYRASKCISDLVRLRVFEIRDASIWFFTNKRMRELQNLVLLQLYDCTKLRVLSLVGLDRLRHLELVELPNLVTVTLTESSGTEDGGILESLVFVRLACLHSLTHVPDLRSCTSLRAIEVVNCRKVPDLEGVECRHVRRMELHRLARFQLERLPNFSSLHCLTFLLINFSDDLDLSEAVDLASPYKLLRRRRGQIVSLQVREDADESSDGSDEDSGDFDAHFVEDTYNRLKTIIYKRLEEQVVKEGLSFVENVLAYLVRRGWHHTDLTGSGCGSSQLLWTFVEGDNERLQMGPYNGSLFDIEWRYRSPEE